MEFYEFNYEFQYYALIAADSLENAIKEYQKNVSEIQEDCHSLPEQVSRDYALEKYEDACYSVGYTPDFEVDENCVLLMDESLL